MARLSPAQSSALATWWDLAQSAASGGFTVTDTVSAARDIAQQAGQRLAFEESAAISTLYGYARRMSNAAGVFQAADASNTITNDMIGVPPWARDEVEMNTAPLWHSTFAMTFETADGDIRTEFRTSVFEMTLPGTVGELADAIDADAQAMAEKYRVRLISAQPVQILAV